MTTTYSFEPIFGDPMPLPKRLPWRNEIDLMLVEDGLVVWTQVKFEAPRFSYRPHPRAAWINIDPGTQHHHDLKWLIDIGLIAGIMNAHDFRTQTIVLTPEGRHYMDSYTLEEGL